MYNIIVCVALVDYIFIIFQSIMTTVQGITYQYVPSACMTQNEGNNCQSGETGTCYGCGQSSNQFNNNCLGNGGYYCAQNTVYKGGCTQDSCDSDWYLGQSNDGCKITNQYSTCMGTDKSQCHNSELSPSAVQWYTGATAPDGSTTLYLCPNQGYPYACTPFTSGRPIECTFDLVGNFETVAQINEWLNIYGPYDINSQAYNETIMPYFCNRPTQPGNPDDIGCSVYNPIVTTSVCSLTAGGTAGMTAAMEGTDYTQGPTVVAGLTGCSRIHAKGQAGVLCQQWAAGGENGGYQSYVDGMMNSFCGKYSCSQDCLCINAGIVDPTFISITTAPGGGSVLDAYPCWYIPCQGTTDLVTSILSSDLTTCPQQVCTSVQDIIDNQGTVNETNNDNINCPSGGTGSTGGSSPYVESIWDQYGTYILIGLGAIVFIIIVLIAIAIFSKSKHKK
jgi:hypothetical protein